ncbi:unnamed protein product [Cuscuta campestris]|uniref:Uncharacterized protein n=1 Tax=Cuscuta campestris TaxID=132261 RepID=A0A484N5I2_9ASTE|nr:unnamed protein product [Cuscuta campestris]
MQILSEHRLSKERRGEGNATKNKVYAASTHHFSLLKVLNGPKICKNMTKAKSFSIDELKIRFKEMQISSLKSGS